MVHGTGVDIIEVDRFQRLNDALAFARTILTDNELRRIPPGPNQSAAQAALFAVKEAILKALGCGLHDGSFWHDMEVANTGDVKLSGHLASLAQQQSISAIHSSHSCSENRVVAFVVMENDRQEDTP